VRKLALIAATAVAALWIVPQTGSYAEPARAACHDGIDNDGDGAIDHPYDTGCSSAADESEEDAVAPAPQCSDGVDNDGDGAIDHPYDTGCDDANDATEESTPEPPPAECADGTDNDGDGATDYPADPDCSSPTDASEAAPASCRVVGSVEACMDVVPGAHVASYTAHQPDAELLHVAGFVHLYRFTLPNGGTVVAPCVVLGVGSDSVNPCTAAGGTFERRLRTLVNDNAETPDSTLATPLTKIRVCTAELVTTVNDVGVSSFPGYAVC
jgi:hypothetical protein